MILRWDSLVFHPRLPFISRVVMLCRFVQYLTVGLAIPLLIIHSLSTVFYFNPPLISTAKNGAQQQGTSAKSENVVCMAYSVLATLGTIKKLKNSRILNSMSYSVSKKVAGFTCLAAAAYYEIPCSLGIYIIVYGQGKRKKSFEISHCPYFI